MANIYMLMGVLAIILATLKTSGVDGRQFRKKMMNLRSFDESDESEEKRTVPQSLMVDYVVKENTIGANRFDCTHIKNSVQNSGVCILPLNEAVAYCNAERKCGGIGITTNDANHKAFDVKNRMPSAELFAGSAVQSSAEWTLYIKQ